MNFFYRPTEIITKIAAADNDSEDIMDILSRILDEMNERAERCKKHDFEYGGLCIDDPEHPFDDLQTLWERDSRRCRQLGGMQTTL